MAKSRIEKEREKDEEEEEEEEKEKTDIQEQLLEFLNFWCLLISC
jgi:hypothetical protein